jgi:hypothetical protein
LPGYAQPGISPLLSQLYLGIATTSSLLEYSLTHLENNKLYYVLKSYLGTQDEEEKYLLGADIEGDFAAPTFVKKVYRRVFGETVVFNGNFIKSKHITDYIAFLAKLFRLQGYGGWVILFDEAELIGRLGRKSRHNAYLNMHQFLHTTRPEGLYTLFAFNASFIPDVIEAKHEFENISKNTALFPEMAENIAETLGEIAGATQLTPLSREEIAEILEKILQYHGAAFGWDPRISKGDFMMATDPYGYLLRTRIRAAVEILDQLYQYGEVGEIKVSELGQITFEEDQESLIEPYM